MMARRFLPPLSSRFGCVLLATACAVALATTRARASPPGEGDTPPSEWARLALAPCVEAAERTRAADARLALALETSAQSREQKEFLQREAAARRSVEASQRAAALARLDFLLLGSKIEVPELRAPPTRIGYGESFRALLNVLFGQADPCALDALETTILFSVFGMPFDAASAGMVGPFQEFQAIGAVTHGHLAAGRSLAEIFGLMRPASADLASAYVGALARVLLEPTASGPVPDGTEGIDDVTDQHLRQFLEVTQLAAEPLRIQAYLHARVEEVEGALGTPVPNRAAMRLTDGAESTLYRDVAAMRRLRERTPAAIVDALTPDLDRWFRGAALGAIRESLDADPFAAYWFFVQSGATPEPGVAFPRSRVPADAVLTLSSLGRLTYAEGLARFREARVPAHFLERHARLEAAFAGITVPRDEALRRIEDSGASRPARDRLRQFVIAASESSDFSALDAYALVLRDASRISGRVDWETLGAALDLLHQVKRQRLDDSIEQTLASDPAPDPRLRAYLETTCALMLELERRQAKERRFQQRTSGALVGWLLSQFMLSGGVPVELWAPGGVNGAEFADLVDVLTPKNPASGNDYHGKPADQIRLVYEGREYHQTLVQVIDSAQQFINISVFDWKTDVGGRDIAYRLMAKKLGIDGDSYERFLATFRRGVRLDPLHPSPTPFYDIPTTRLKDLLVWHFVLESSRREIVEAREAARSAGASLACDSVLTCGDLRSLLERAGDVHDSAEASPEHQRAWRAYQQLEELFADGRVPLSDVRPRRALRDYVDDPDALRRLISRFGPRRPDRPDEPLAINIVADSKQVFSNLHPGQPSGYFPYVGSDPIRDIYFPLLEFDIRLVLWKGPLEFPWRVGPVPLPGRKILGRIPMPFIPYPWLNAVPGLGSIGTVGSIFLQYLLASDPRVYWGMVSHTKSWSNEAMAMESGMGMGSKYFNFYDEHKTWHDMGVAVHGAPAEDVNDHFVQVFNQARVNNTGIPSSRGVAVPALRYEDYRASAQPADLTGDDTTWLVTTHPEQGDSNYRGVFLAALAAARSNIYIENLFFSDPLIARMLMRKAREFRGRVSCDGLSDNLCAERKRDAVQIYLVLPDATDKPIVDAVGTADFYEMIHLGIKIRRWSPPAGWSATRMLHTKAWLIDYQPDRGGLTYVGAANATQRSHLSDNEAGFLSTSRAFANDVYTRIFERDITTDSRLEGPEEFHVTWSSRPAVRASRWLRRFLVDLLWFM